MNNGVCRECSSNAELLLLLPLETSKTVGRTTPPEGVGGPLLFASEMEASDLLAPSWDNFGSPFASETSKVSGLFASPRNGCVSELLLLETSMSEAPPGGADAPLWSPAPISGFGWFSG